MGAREHNSLHEILGKLPFPEYVFLKKREVVRFTGNGLAEMIEKIFNAFAYQREKGIGGARYNTWNPENYSESLSCFNAKEKAIIFCVLYVKLIDGEHFPGKLDLNFLKLLRVICKVSESTYKSINSFFKIEIPYKDKMDSIYFSGIKENKLIVARGLNIVFSLEDQNETIYVKYIKQVDIFLMKKFQENPIYNTLRSKTTICDFKLYTGEKIEVGNEFLGHFELLQLLEKKSTYRTIRVEPKEFMPSILLSAEENKIIISGRSIPLSPSNYLEPILDWLELFKQYGGKQLHVQLNLEYYNTYTYKFLLRFLAACRALEENGKRAIITWYFSPDDEEMIESGNQMKHFYNGLFHCLPINDRVASLV